ncbi:hypothetical protein E2C01_051940 [Portunus trituberculatus]|uniref:Uncharacterized protein n=1 Tax=Portunus trituberculatus TaxID=210409 RepID=A0A5B7GLS0_PORTR|nr:hypothetical protein [Portunus trituberculatus]
MRREEKQEHKHARHHCPRVKSTSEGKLPRRSKHCADESPTFMVWSWRWVIRKAVTSRRREKRRQQLHTSLPHYSGPSKAGDTRPLPSNAQCS